MLECTRLIEAIQTRVVLWGLLGVYDTMKEAKFTAARAYAQDKMRGVSVRQSTTGKYAVLIWGK